METTINDPGKFKVFRHKQGQPEHEPKQRLTMRKGAADIPLRAAVSQQVNNRFMDNLAKKSSAILVWFIFLSAASLGTSFAQCALVLTSPA
ncbi:MAG: hypothetical protein CSA32_00965, partial [Desulfobulbus propionicus]